MELYFTNLQFVSPMKIYQPLTVLDLSKGPIADLLPPPDVNDAAYALGRYNERRPQSYLAAQYAAGTEQERNIHVGIDLVAAVGAPIFSSFSGKVFSVFDHALSGDYGPTIITIHKNYRGQNFWVLYGHLSRESLSRWRVGNMVVRGDLIGQVGDRHENGGWFPHLHFQLSLIEPKGGDLPGVVSSADLAQALVDYPDPSFVLGL